MISERFFSVFDSNQDQLIDLEEFIHGMTILFSEDYSQLTKFIFDLYDFDRDGKISKEDIRIIYSYIPLQNSDKISFA
jgi:Ca2+-binding EF-hand superfamily protein